MITSLLSNDGRHLRNLLGNNPKVIALDIVVKLDLLSFFDPNLQFCYNIKFNQSILIIVFIKMGKAAILTLKIWTYLLLILSHTFPLFSNALCDLNQTQC